MMMLAHLFLLLLPIGTATDLRLTVEQLELRTPTSVKDALRSVTAHGRERQLWSDRLDVEALAAFQSELAELRDSSAHAPLSCRKESSPAWARAPPWADEWFASFASNRRPCVLSLLNTLLDAHGLNGMLVAAVSSNSEQNDPFKHGIGRFLAAGTHRHRRGDDDDMRDAAAASAVLELLIQNTVTYVALIHGFVWEGAKFDYHRLRQLLGPTSEPAADLLRVNASTTSARFVWKAFGKLSLRAYPRHNGALLHLGHGFGHGLHAMYSALPDGFKLAAQMCGRARLALADATPAIARADEEALAAELASMCFGGVMQTEKSRIERGVYQKFGLVNGVIDRQNSAAMSDFWSSYFDCQDAWVPPLARAGCYNIYFRLWIGKRHNTQFPLAPHPDHPVPRDATAPLRDDAPAAAVVACGNIATAARPACLFGFAAAFFCAGARAREARDAARDVAAARDPMVSWCDASRGSLARYCSRLDGDERRACVSGGSSWAFLSATPFRDNLPSAATALHFCRNVTGDEIVDDRDFAVGPRGCVRREAGCVNESYTPSLEPSDDALAVCFRAATTAVPGGRLATFGNCEFSTCRTSERRRLETSSSCTAAPTWRERHRDLCPTLSKTALESGIVHYSADLARLHEKIARREAITVVALGGSITAGQGLKLYKGAKDERYDAVLVNMLNAHFPPANGSNRSINMGFHGANIHTVAPSTAAYLDPKLTECGADLFVLEFALNNEVAIHVGYGPFQGKANTMEAVAPTEALVRQVLESHPGIAIVMLDVVYGKIPDIDEQRLLEEVEIARSLPSFKCSADKEHLRWPPLFGAADWHGVVACHYAVTQLSMVTAIAAELTAGNESLVGPILKECVKHGHTTPIEECGQHSDFHMARWGHETAASLLYYSLTREDRNSDDRARVSSRIPPSPIFSADFQMALFVADDQNLLDLLVSAQCANRGGLAGNDVASNPKYKLASTICQAAPSPSCNGG